MNGVIEDTAYYILIIDDKTNFQVLKDIFHQEAFHTLWASNAVQAAALLESQQIDLILIDIRILRENPSIFTKQLTSEKNQWPIPVVFMVAFDAVDDLIQGFDLGGKDYVTKPFQQQAVSQRIRQHAACARYQRTIQRQQGELQDILEDRNKVFASMAHDIRSPVSSLKMILSILAAKTEESQEISEMLYLSSDIAEKLFAQVDNQLKWTKSNLGLQSYAPQRFKLDETIRSVIGVLSPTAKLKNISFDLTLEQGVDVYFDQDIMKSILSNLLINAIKYSHLGSRILVRLYTADTLVVFEVEDYGVGMNEDTQAKLKNKVFGHSLTGTAHEGGTGLGLWLVQHFLQANEGKFYFVSKENKGSRFGIKIPQANFTERQQSVSI